jgi:hypothetical protein
MRIILQDITFDDAGFFLFSFYVLIPTFVCSLGVPAKAERVFNTQPFEPDQAKSCVGKVNVKFDIFLLAFFRALLCPDYYKGV